MSGVLRILPDLAPSVVRTITGLPRSVVPSVPPEPSYSSTWSRTHCSGLGWYSPTKGTSFSHLGMRHRQPQHPHPPRVFPAAAPLRAAGTAVDHPDGGIAGRAVVSGATAGCGSTPSYGSGPREPPPAQA